MNKVTLIGVIIECTSRSIKIDIDNINVEVLITRKENQKVGQKVAIEGELIIDPIDDNLKVVCYNNKDQNNCLIF
jgi:hypothetical protein